MELHNSCRPTDCCFGHTKDGFWRPMGLSCIVSIHACKTYLDRRCVHEAFFLPAQQFWEAHCDPASQSQPPAFHSETFGPSGYNKMLSNHVTLISTFASVEISVTQKDRGFWRSTLVTIIRGFREPSMREQQCLAVGARSAGVSIA